MINKFIINIITIYQKTLSPDHGFFSVPYNGCRFYPSCSHYTKESIIKRGLLLGLIKSSWRILRCHPLSKGGYDPVL